MLQLASLVRVLGLERVRPRPRVGPVLLDRVLGLELDFGTYQIARSRPCTYSSAETTWKSLVVQRIG